MSPEEQAVVRRIVHAGGDPQLAGLVKFGPAAITGGLAALAAGSPIFTDVGMVAAGINRRLADTCGCAVRSVMDEVTVPEQTDGRHLTRAAAAMHRLGRRLDGAIVAIGNAPTALLALLELMAGDGVRPALVVGMPVGFVQAKESKVLLMKRGAPYITISGTRGGSALAVATVNALLKMAAERKGA